MALFINFRYNMERKKEEESIEIRDLSLCAYLLSTNMVKFLGKRKTVMGDVFFQFSPRQKTEELINKYWRLEAPTIQPKLLFSAQRDLKDMIFGG
jgi:hypothetical protein